MKKIVKLTCCIVLAFSFSVISSCNKPDEPEPNTSENKDTIIPKPVVLSDTLKGKWEVVDATHNGKIDNSSMGIKLIFNTDGTFLLTNTSYNGTWEFIENKTKILIDKSSPDFKSTWTINTLTNKNFDVTFKSSFTGGTVVWKMERYKW